MKSEYQRIADEAYKGWSERGWTTPHLCNVIAERCEALANKPVRELTDEEITSVHLKSFQSDAVPLGRTMLSLHRAMIAAHIAKQSEPEEIPFDQAKLDEGGWEVVLRNSEGNYCAPVYATKVTLVRKT